MKFLFLLISLNIFLVQNNLFADEFYFEGEEIQILDEGNKLLSKNGVKITANNNFFEGDEFEYDKTKLELVLNNNVRIMIQRKIYPFTQT